MHPAMTGTLRAGSCAFALRALPFICSSQQHCVMCWQALAVQPGHSILDVGSGSGYLTMLAAHLVGETGTAVGVEVRSLAMDPLADQAQAAIHARSC